MRFLGILFALALFGAAEARADRARDAREVAILVDGVTKSQSTGDLVKAVVTGLRTELKECPRARIQGATSATDCIHYILGGIIDRAYDKGKGKLDKVERTVLKRIFSTVVVTDTGDVKIDTSLDPGAGGKGVEQPALYSYRDRKQQFAELRKAKGQPEELNSEVLALVDHAYLRKMKGAGALGSGQISAEEYLAARFSRLELNTLSGLLTAMLDQMAHSSGRIILDQPDYASRAARVDALEQEVLDLTARIAHAAPADQPALLAKLAEKQGALAREKAGMPADQLFVQLQEKKAERDRAVDAVLEPNIDPAERATRAERVDALDKEVQAIQAQLDAQRIEIDLPPSDVDKVAVKSLKIEMKKLTERGSFRGQQLEFGDIVMAAWISGEIDSELVKVVLDMNALGEPRDSILKKVATIAWRVGSAVAVINPISAYAVAIAGIIITSVEQAKERKKEEADEGSLVRE